MMMRYNDSGRILNKLLKEENEKGGEVARGGCLGWGWMTNIFFPPPHVLFPCLASQMTSEF